MQSEENPAYGVETGGELFGMTIADFDRYVAAHNPHEHAGLELADGLITALTITPLDLLPGQIAEAVRGSSFPAEYDDHDWHFCGAVLARIIEINTALAVAPVPKSLLGSWDAWTALKDHPEAYPLMHHDDGRFSPVYWAIGFHAGMMMYPTFWSGILAQHPYYSLLESIMYFLPNRRGYPTNKSIITHSVESRTLLAMIGIPADVITAFHYLRQKPERTLH